MADRLSPARRSWNMSRIRGADTAPERLVRSILHGLGLRFRLHRADLPGKPDIVLPRWKAAVFVHGCFWHRHPGCRFAYSPKSRVDFWLKKFDDNVRRDARNAAALEAAGWKTIIVWECETANPVELTRRLRREIMHGVHRERGRR